jgi:CelD/BcsL family acetyltransferase involved in cellulose biosynthesis
VASQQLFQQRFTGVAESLCLDLSDGFDAYRERRRSTSAKTITEALRKGRQLSREVRPLRFEADTADRSVFTRLLEWKSAQYARRISTNAFAYGWTVQLMERILAPRGETFAGMLWAFTAGIS